METEQKDYRKTTNICQDCMNGNHEMIGHPDCDCYCHNNPQCFVCGSSLVLIDDRHAGYHTDCWDEYVQQEENRTVNEPFGRYPWER